MNYKETGKFAFTHHHHLTYYGYKGLKIQFKESTSTDELEQYTTEAWVKRARSYLHSIGIFKYTKHQLGPIIDKSMHSVLFLVYEKN